MQYELNTVEVRDIRDSVSLHALALLDRIEQAQASDDYVTVNELRTKYDRLRKLLDKVKLSN